MKSEDAPSLLAPAFSDEMAPRRSTPMDRWALRRIQDAVRDVPIRFTLWDGYERAPADRPPIATIQIKNRPALYAWMWQPELNFGEAYMSGALEVRGDLVELLSAVYISMAASGSKRRWW